MFHMWYTCNIIDLGANNLCSELLASKVLFSSCCFLPSLFFGLFNLLPSTLLAFMFLFLLVMFWFSVSL